MKKVIQKELVLASFLFSLSLLTQHLLGYKMIGGWLIFSIILIALFVSSTFLYDWFIKRKPEHIGALFAGVTLLSQAILLTLLFIVLKPTKENHRAFAILGLTNYLLFLLLDTRWKLKWFFKSTP